jgi:hypothetical protein
MELSAGGTSFDHFFVAMVSWQQGNKELANQWYMCANVWMKKHNPDHPVLLRFRQEAESLLGSHPSPVYSESRQDY